MDTERAHADPLERPLAGSISGITPVTAREMERRLGIATVRDLLEHVPRRYVDLSRTKPIGELRIGEEATIVGTVRRVEGRYITPRRAAPAKGKRPPAARRRPEKHLLTVTVSDGSGVVQGVWWNQPFRQKAFTEGVTVAVAGRLERRMGKLSITNPYVEVLRSPSDGGIHTSRVIPVHPATEKISANQIRRYVHLALERFADAVPEPIPEALLDRLDLVDRTTAIREIHFPSSKRAKDAALRRLVFEELFVMSAGLALRKRRIERETKGIEHTGGEPFVEAFLSSLPFTPTGAQRRSIDEIAQDLALPRPMNRLLQGEVGSGKTVVAVAAALLAAGSGSQTAFMAPTEVLAEQHYLTVRRLLEPVADLAPAGEGRLFGGGFGVTLLTGSVTGRDRERALEEAASGEATIVIGTHALIQEGVRFHRLGLAVVDEQHRFGVHQRVALRSKAEGDLQPDVLIMTATPIPRTLALTLYGDLDVSALNEMPKGRTPVDTTIAATPEARAAAYDLIRAEVAAGRQAYVVCPLVSTSESLEAKAAESEHDRLAAEELAGLRLGLLHGRMKPAEKEKVMSLMRAGEIDVLVATTVIEVGVDVPNATVMLIEDADRFGLSQLHQLRGRVGRGQHRSYCVLATSVDLESDEEERQIAARRLRAMAATTDGFELAEEDLRIRGEGQIFGRGRPDEDKGAPFQAGRSDLRFARLLRDHEVLVEARRAAFAVVDADPHLAAREHELLLAEVKRRFADRLDWLFAS